MPMPPSHAPPSLLLAWILLAWPRDERALVRAHSLFAALADDGDVRVFLSEPVAVAGEGRPALLGGRVARMSALGPASSAPVALAARDGYLAGSLSPASAPSARAAPLLVAGFLDFGDSGRGDGPAQDLQYTFSAQRFSTNPFDDWVTFFQDFEDMRGYADAFPGDRPFAIVLRNWGPPYEVVARGIAEDAAIDVCLYEDIGSNNKFGCVSGTAGPSRQVLLDVDDAVRLQPCATYFALANTTDIDSETGQARTRWSSTSVTWNGPCAAGPRAAAAVAPGASPARRSPALFFGVGCLFGMAALFLTTLGRRNYSGAEGYAVAEGGGGYTDAAAEEEADAVEMS